MISIIRATRERRRRDRCRERLILRTPGGHYHLTVAEERRMLKALSSEAELLARCAECRTMAASRRLKGE
jgi:hypothetical protein